MSAAEEFRNRGRELMANRTAVEHVPAAQVRVVNERRDPTGATLPVTTRYSRPGAPMISEWNAEQAYRLAYFSNVIVYRCMQILADTVAGCPFRAGDAPPIEPGAPTKHNVNARLAQLLGPPPGGPIPNKLTARRLWAWTVVQRKLTGRHGWEIEADPSTKEIVALWPLVSSEINPIPTVGGAEWFSAFEYGQDPKSKKPKTLKPNQILYGWNPSATDFRQPESCLQAARLDVSIAVMLARYNLAFLKNDARPAAVVVTEAFESDEAFYAFKAQWGGQYGGPDNAGKVAFVETSDDPDSSTPPLKPSEAIGFATLGLSQRDAMFMEQEKASLERVAMACGVPWSRLSATERTYSNAGQEDSNFWMDTMLPLLSDLADEVNMQLAPRLGREVGWFDLSHVQVFKATRTTLAIDPVALWKNKIAMLDESRDIVGLPPVDGGDRFITDAELGMLAGPAPVPIARESFAELQQAVALPTAAEIATLVAAQMRVVPDVEHRDALAALPPIEQRVVDPDEVEQRRAVIWKATNATVRTFEKQWATAMQRLFTRQRKQVLSRLEGRTGRGNIGQRVAEGRASTDDVFDPDYWVGETTDAVEPLYSNVTAAALGKMADVFGVAFDLEAAFVTDFIQARANKLAGQVTDTTYTAIRDAMSEGTQAGETITEIADRVRAVFDLADAVRAETIARTEVNSAYGGSTRLASEALPADVLGGFQWIATRDGRTRDDHADADGQTVGPDGTFDVGGEQLEYPGDPAGDPANTVNCRCAMVALTPDDMDGRARVSIEHAAAVLGGLRGPVDELALRRVLRGQRALPAPVEPSVDQQTAPMPPIHLTINMPDQPPVNVQVDPAQVNVTVEPPPPAEVNVQVDAPEVNVTMPPERAKVAVRDPETGAVLRWEPEAS